MVLVQKWCNVVLLVELMKQRADKIGLTLMQLQDTIQMRLLLFWSRMAAKFKGQSPPEFMSTHLMQRELLI
jgi:hypothetical protein